jgi:hypothetical protein
MAPLYTNRTAFEDYVEGWVTDDAAALDRLLERAERDVDALFVLLPIITSGTYAGRRFDPTTLAAWEREALSNCVCAQAEFRFMRGEEQIARGRTATSVKGPDFEQAYSDVGTAGRYSPKLDIELQPLSRWRQLGARARA